MRMTLQAKQSQTPRALESWAALALAAALTVAALVVVGPAQADDAQFLFDALHAKGLYHGSWEKLMKLVQPTPDWLVQFNKNFDGVAGQMTPLSIEGKPYMSSFVCKPTECGEHKFVVLFDEKGAHAFGALGGKRQLAGLLWRAFSGRTGRNGQGCEGIKAMDLDLKGKLALVSGSTAGIGFAIATALAKEGAEVIVNGRTKPAVDKALAEIRTENGAEAIGFAGDLSKAEIAEQLFQAHPGVEILVNNLGIFEPKAYEDIPDADWLRLFEVNVLSGARLARLYLPGMRQTNWGRIIFISSESAIQIPAEMIHYGMTKAAQIAISRGIAEAVAGTGITVNSVLPGATRSRGVTDFVETLAKNEGITFEAFETKFFETMRPTQLLKRFTTPAEIASLVAYLASPLAAGTTGAAVRVDGGTVKSAF